jgi:hypothetical protein
VIVKKLVTRTETVVARQRPTGGHFARLTVSRNRGPIADEKFAGLRSLRYLPSLLATYEPARYRSADAFRRDDANIDVCRGLRRWVSPSTMIWRVYSRRMDPINLSATPTRRDRLVTDAHCAKSAPQGDAVDLISIADQVKWSFIPGKCLRDLTCNPFRARMRCYIDPDKISAGQSDDDEDVEQRESDARNHE